MQSILLVDDDSLTCFLEEDLLKEMNLAEHIYIARNGKEALSFITENCGKAADGKCPDLVLLDIFMPVMDGFEFLEEFKKLNNPNHHTRIIILTSSNDERDIEKANRYHVLGYICKPLTKDKLLKALH